MIYKPVSMALFGLALFYSSCQSGDSSLGSTMQTDTINTSLHSKSFNGLIEGKTVELYTLKNKNGMTVDLTNFGARIVGIIVPDRNHKPTDVVLGFKQASDYNNPEEPYFGSIVGPFANRIANAVLHIDKQSYHLSINNGPNTLHGGIKGLHFVHWDATQDSSSVTFRYTFSDGQEGFPGNTQIEVKYSLLDDNSLKLDYEAVSDKKTALNLSNHAYFNLNGEGSGTILQHQLQIYASEFTPVDSTLIPTGEIKSVYRTAFDFTKAKEIGQDIENEDIQLQFGKGYDHNYVLNTTKKEDYRHAAKVIGDKSGIIMDIYTQEPGLQFYSGNFMAEKVSLKNGAKDSFRTAFCLEPQNFPDAPHHRNFPNSIYSPNQRYSSSSIYSFSTL